MSAQSWGAELIVVDNGSSDRTAEIVAELATDRPEVRLLHEAEPGKGAAVRTGMRAGRGEHLFMCDADLAMPIDQVVRLLPPRCEACDIAIASREGPGARRHGEPHHRHLMGRAFNLFVQAVAMPGIRDTQCGFKSFRRDVAREVFAHQTMTGFGFDVEVLFIARRRGYRIREVPIEIGRASCRERECHRV